MRFAALAIVAVAFSAQAAPKTAPAIHSGAETHSFNAVTDKTEVNAVLKAVIKANLRTKDVYVITGTHGAADGTVHPEFKELDFREDDLESANRTSSKIHVLKYQTMSPATWKQIHDRAAGSTAVVLAWCFSNQWLANHTANGNNGKL
jgi:hypothetical protein